MSSPASLPLVLVTGASQGIGRAVAQALAGKHNYHVLLGVRNPQSGETVAAPLRDAGHQASVVQLDLTSPTSIEATIKYIQTRFGYLDVLINNAGILIDHHEGQTTWDLFTKTFTTNVMAGPPRVVFVSSVMGSLERSTDKTTPYYPIDYKAYDASKAAVNMLTLNYARILDDAGGKANCVCPGYVKTALTDFNEYGHSPEVGAERIVELATLGEDGPTRTYSDRNGPLPW
ncbi:hypothetical protein NCS55_01428500 [Fusarium keratoplasticum]|nr:hypothetical protein NCS55_01428500 [Fusarium keratoplasticum]